MAAGVFKQVKGELRRLHRARTPLKRELYLDAYSWAMSEDDVMAVLVPQCVPGFLNLSPEEARQELLGGLAFRPWVGTRRCGLTAPPSSDFC